MHNKWCQHTASGPREAFKGHIYAITEMRFRALVLQSISEECSIDKVGDVKLSVCRRVTIIHCDLD